MVHFPASHVWLLEGKQLELETAPTSHSSQMFPESPGLGQLKQNWADEARSIEVCEYERDTDYLYVYTLHVQI